MPRNDADSADRIVSMNHREAHVGDVPSKEKRRFLRVDDNFRATVAYVDRAVDGGEPPIGVAWSRNLSIGGFAFAADRSVDVGEQLRVHVDAPEIPGGLDFLAESVRCVPSVGRPGSWEISVRFLPAGTSESTRQKVERLVYARRS